MSAVQCKMPMLHVASEQAKIVLAGLCLAIRACYLCCSTLILLQQCVIIRILQSTFTGEEEAAAGGTSLSPSFQSLSE